MKPLSLTIKSPWNVKSPGKIPPFAAPSAGSARRPATGSRPGWKIEEVWQFTQQKCGFYQEKGEFNQPKLGV